MPTESPLRPNLLKGALAIYPADTPGSQPVSVIVFQFNPDTMNRTLANRAPPAPASGKTGSSKEDVLRVAGPPLETITLTVEMTADQQLEDPDNNAVVAEHGLHPVLAALEMLMYPPTDDAQSIESQAESGAVQVNPANLPLVLFVWGKSRVVPVKLTSFAVSEEAFDRNLNPIAAKVALGMQVLTYMEFTDSSFGRDAFLAYQQAKESLAQMAQPGTTPNTITSLLPS